VLRLAQSSGLVFADEQVSEATFADFDEPFFSSRYLEDYQEEMQELDIRLPRLLTNIKLMKGENLTLAGLLLFGKKPEQFRPQFTCKATSFAGKDITANAFRDKEDIHGKLIEQYQKGVAFITRNLRRIQVHENFNAPGQLEIPKLAFSEALANAIVHRSYYLNAPIQIYLFDDRLEIVSPGNLPNTINEDNIKYGVHVERNPTLLSFLEKAPEFSYTGRGSGVPRILKVCKQEGVDVRFTDDKTTQQFKIIFSRRESQVH